MRKGGIPIKKTSILLLVFVLIGSSFSATALFEHQYNPKIIQQQEQIIIPSPILSTEHRCTTVTLKDATSTILQPGEPMLPKISKTFILPIGSTITDTIMKQSNPTKYILDSKIIPAPEPLINGQKPSENRFFSKDVYEKDELYPINQYTSHKSIGLKNGQRVLFFTIHYYPIRYNPVQNTLFYTDTVEFEIEYILPTGQHPANVADEQDLLIIYPELFTEEVQPLIQHKNEFNMRTYAKTVEEIYSEYTNGRDNQEKIKFAIKDAIESKGISYVLLFGGLNGQSRDWFIPVRYAHSLDESYISDLYYADVYKTVDSEIVFEDWDANGNSKFAEFDNSVQEDIDGAPDVYLGRLACRSEKEATTVVNKIINYEKTKADESWFKHMLLIGGDTYPYDGNYTGCEAEIDTNLSASYMDGFTFTRLWASTGTLTGQQVVVDAINDGAGFIHMAGHANPASLVTHPPFNKSEKIIIMQMYNFLQPLNINPKLTNEDKLPVIVVGGCHNSQFNVTLLNLIKGFRDYGIKGMFFQKPYQFHHMEWVPECWSWWLTSKADGGAIATMGNTGLGMGIGGQDYVTGLDGWLFPRFFYHYGQEGEHFVGEAFSSAITDYVNEFNVNMVSNECVIDMVSNDRQMIQQWALLGDPSLMIGGYEN